MKLKIKHAGRWVYLGEKDGYFRPPIGTDIVDVDDKIGKKLLTTKNFELIEEPKPKGNKNA